MSEKNDITRDMGTQPLDGILIELSLNNPDLVAASTEQLTHKQVQKARKGRRVSENIQGKICRALNVVCEGKRQFEVGELFEY